MFSLFICQIFHNNLKFKKSLKKKVLEYQKFIQENLKTDPAKEKNGFRTSLFIEHPLIENKKVNFKYAVKINENPITIKIYCNFANKIKNDYKRYLINNFNKKFKIINQKTRLVVGPANRQGFLAPRHLTMLRARCTRASIC